VSVDLLLLYVILPQQPCAVYRQRVGNTGERSFAVPEIPGYCISMQTFFLLKLCILMHSIDTFEGYGRFVCVS